MKTGTRQLLDKADRAIQAADILLAAAGAEFAAGRVYYAMFYTAEALLHERGQKFSKHGAVHAAYGKEFAKSGLLDPKFHRWLINAFDVRLQEDYDAETLLSGEHVEEMLEQARTFLAAAQEFLRKEDQSESPSS
jgi:uncharacterized protein (UPF0332 family)